MKPAFTGVLEDEHRLIEQVVARMALLAEDVAGGKPVERSTLEGLVEFLRIYADQLHHGKEETRLFPALEAKGVPPNGCPLGALKHEHEKGRTLVAQFDAAVHGYRGGDAGSAEQVSKAMNALVDLYPGHIWKEDHLLFPLAEKVLPPAEQAALNEEFARLDAEIGPDLQRRFEQLAPGPAKGSGLARQPVPSATRESSLIFDLAAEVAALRSGPAWSRGRNTKALVREPNLRIVLVSLRAKEKINEHRTAAGISIQTVAGRIRVRAASQTIELPPGHLLALERDVPHAVEALEESAFLLTIGSERPAA
ncbi:MAG TPA: hemerythrin domain-containing protein [Bryobacteraceae bacterium]